jgi:GGDEF domain-containing protein
MTPVVIRLETGFWKKQQCIAINSCTKGISSAVMGDEFSILMLETHIPQALEDAERLRQISFKPFDAGHVKFTVTISLGVAVLKENTAGWKNC